MTDSSHPAARVFTRVYGISKRLKTIDKGTHELRGDFVFLKSGGATMKLVHATFGHWHSFCAHNSLADEGTDQQGVGLRSESH